MLTSAMLTSDMLKGSVDSRFNKVEIGLSPI